MSCCPTCGSAMPAEMAPEQVIEALPLSPLERALAMALVEQFGRDVPSARLLDRMYRHYPDGGPLSAASVLRVMAFNLRQKLRPHGLTARGRGGRGPSYGASGCYRMTYLPGEA